jgi:hypothetical protein
VIVGLLTLILGSFFTHLFTEKRERSKASRERTGSWLATMKDDIKRITDATMDHYCNPPPNPYNETVPVAIMCDLKRLQANSVNAKFVNLDDAKYLGDAIVDLNDQITGHQDFQNPRRTALPGNDPFIQKVINSEEYIVAVASRPQR